MEKRKRKKETIIPTPSRISEYLELGDEVETPYGVGKIIDFLLATGEWASGKKTLVPPAVVVHLDLPWKNEFIYTVPLNDVSIPGKGKVFEPLVNKIWKRKEPSVNLKPTVAKKLSQLLRKEKERKKRKEEEEDDFLSEDEIWNDEEIDPNVEDYGGNTYNYPVQDPNGNFYYTEMFNRMPFRTRTTPVNRYYSFKLNSMIEDIDKK